MDKGVELTVTADEVSRSWSSPVKSYGVCYGVISTADTCLLAVWQASFRRQELYPGFITELGNPAWAGGRLIRSSEEVPVMGMERRD